MWGTERDCANMSTEAAPLRRESATVMFMDVVESMRLIGQDELAGVTRIRALLAEAEARAVQPHEGRVIERRGDGLLLRFAHPRQAVRCAAILHQLAREASDAQPGAQPLRLRVGLHRAELLTDDAALYGQGVNLAARIAALGEPGDTLLSASARDELNAELDGELHDLGPCYLKHADEPMRLFRHRAGVAPLQASLQAAIAARMKLRPTLVILPVTVLGERPGAGPGTDLGLGAVLTDQLTRLLSQSALLHVISALSAQALRGREVDRNQLYRTLRADYVLQGQLLGGAQAAQATGTSASGQGLSLQAQLWRQGAGEPIWSDTVRGTALDALSGQSDLLGRVVQAVGQRILTVEQRAARAAQALPNLASHTLYLNAVDLLHRFALSDFDRSRQLLQALSDRAPRHAEPLAWLARWHVFKVVQGWSDDSQRDGLQALAYSQRALDRDPQSALALTMAGSVHAGIKRDPVAAQGFYAQALQHNPNDSLAWLMSSVAQGFMTAREPALAASETALGLAPLDPTRPYYDALAATAALRAGELARCIHLAERSIQGNALHGSSYRALAIAQMLSGQASQAAGTVASLLAVEPHFTVQNYRSRVPANDPQSERFALALADAGLPLH